MAIFLETDRLIHRQFTDTEDYGALLLDLDSDPAVMRYIGPFGLGNNEAYREWIRINWLPYYDSHPARGFWAVREKSTKQFAGWFLSRPSPDFRFASAAGWNRPTDIEIGYRLRQASWGRGPATEVAKRLVRLTLDDPLVTSVVSCALVTNRASTRVMEKAGMIRVREFRLPGFTEPCVMYAVRKEEMSVEAMFVAYHNPNFDRLFIHDYAAKGLPPMPSNDPRVFFAAERTLLAWIRTGLGLVGMGFVVARFGLFIRILHPNAEHVEHSWAGPVGICLALLGAVASIVSTVQHRRFCRTLEANELPPNYRIEPGLMLGFGVALAGLILSVLLM